MKRLLTIAASLLLAAPVQAARTFYQCTMASARGVETMSIDPEAASATHEGKPADLHGYDWGNAVTQLYEFGGLISEDRVNFYPDSMDVTVTFTPASPDGDGAPLVSYGKCVMVES